MYNCDNNLKNDSVSSYIFKKAFLEKKPIECMLELTPYCTLNCGFCAYSYRKGEYKSNYNLSKNDYIKLLFELKEAGVLYLTLTGGEPTLNPDFCEIYEVAAKLGFIITLKTNATNINADVFNTLSKYKPSFTYITLYGGSNESYNIVTGNSCGFDLVSDGIKKIISVSRSVNAVICLIKQNINELPIMYNYLTDLHVFSGFNSDIYPHIDANIKKNITKYRLSPFQRVCLSRYLMKDYKLALIEADRLEKRYENWCISNYKLLMNNIDNRQRDVHEVGLCFDACIGCYIHHNGIMKYCAENQIFYTDIINNSFLDAWNILQSNRDIVYKYNKYCFSCEYKKFCRNNCPARLYLAYNNNMPDMYTCMYAYINKFYESMINDEEL